MIEAADSTCVCTSSRAEAVAVAPFLRCLDCGLVYGDTASERSDAELYDEVYFSRSGYPSYFARAGQWRLEAKRRLRWLLSFGRPKRLVEAGCAGGFFVEAARSSGIDAVGVEPSRVAADYARRELGVPVVLASLEEAEVAGPRDAVCAFHVLEHCADPLRFLEAARRLVRPGGLLALEVPNVESDSARRLGADWPNWQPAHHRWQFSPTTLTRLVEDGGFAVEQCDTVFGRHYVAVRDLPRRFVLATLVADVRATGSLQTVHPSLGDHVRLVARRRP